MTLSDNYLIDKQQDQLKPETMSLMLAEFIASFRKKYGLCPDCGQPGRKNGTTHKKKTKYQCVNARCKRESFNEE